MVRVISQETYDARVKENMCEFELTPEEAVNETVAEFEAQGVNLSNIIKDQILHNQNENEHVVTTVINKIKSLMECGEQNNTVWMEQFELLKSELDKDIAYRIKAGNEEADKLLINILRDRYNIFLKRNTEEDCQFVVSVLQCIVSLMNQNPDLFNADGGEIMKRLLENSKNEEILIHTLKWMSTVCLQHEMNRQNIFKMDIVPTFKRLLLMKPQSKRVLSETMLAIRRFSLDDDIRVQFGKAHDHTRELAIHCLKILDPLLREYKNPPLVSEIMLTIATLCVRNELCKAVSDSVSVMKDIMSDNYELCSVIMQAYKLIIALSGNDDVKKQIMDTGMAPIIVSLMHRHLNNPIACYLSLKCVTVLCLREPDHCKQLIACGVQDEIIQIMKMYPEDGKVQKQAASAIRNLVVRCKEDIPLFLELGAEELLNEAFDKFSQQQNFEIKSALRDLECHVELDEQWKGSGVEIESD